MADKTYEQGYLHLVWETEIGEPRDNGQLCTGGNRGAVGVPVCLKKTALIGVDARDTEIVFYFRFSGPE